MVIAFWILAALDAIGLFLFNPFGSLPVYVLVATIAVFCLAPWQPARWLCLAVTTIPAWALVWNQYDRLRWTYLHDPIRKYDNNPNQRRLVEAMRREDLTAVRRFAAKMDRADEMPLLLAIGEIRAPAVVKILLEQGASKPSHEAVLTALQVESEESLRMLFKAGAAPDVGLFSERAIRRVALTREFVEAGFDASGYAPAAVRCGSFATALYLLDHAHADPRSADLRDEIEKQLEACTVRGTGMPPELLELQKRI